MPDASDPSCTVDIVEVITRPDGPEGERFRELLRAMGDAPKLSHDHLVDLLGSPDGLGEHGEPIYTVSWGEHHREEMRLIFVDGLLFFVAKEGITLM